MLSHPISFILLFSNFILLPSAHYFRYNSHYHQSYDNYRSSGVIRPRLIGGIRVTPHEFPSVVWISRGRTPGNSPVICGGTIISRNLVLTAASCLNTQFPVATYYAVAGDNDRVVFSGSEQTRRGARYFIHPDWEPEKNLENDIAILEIYPPFIFGEKVKAANLPGSSVDPTTAIATALGWGTTDRNPPHGLSDVLRKVDLHEEGVSYCAGIYSNDWNPFTMLCYGGEPGKGACVGDTGGPLMCENEFTLGYTLCGIMSYGKECGADLIPTLHTNVAHFIGWITDVINEHGFLARTASVDHDDDEYEDVDDYMYSDEYSY